MVPTKELLIQKSNLVWEAKLKILTLQEQIVGKLIISCKNENFSCKSVKP